MLAAGVAVIQMLNALVMVATASRLAPAFGLSARAVNPRYLRTALSRSTSYFVISINSLVNTRFDELIIGVVLPLSAVGIYGVSMRLIQMAKNVSQQVNEVLIPRTSRLMSTQGATPELRSMIISATRITVGMITGITLIFIAFGRPFLDLWIGPEVEGAYSPLVILSIALVIGLAQDMPSKTVYASARHRMAAVVTAGGLIANVLLSVLLVHQLDISGVALATLIAWSGAGLVMTVTGCRQVELPVMHFVRDGLMPILVATVPAGLVALLLQEIQPANAWPVLIVEGAAVLALYAAVGLLIMFRPADLRWFAARVVRALRDRRDRLQMTGVARPRHGEEADIEAAR
jgi:O-antigen/teichoic acid export membrane protein